VNCKINEGRVFSNQDVKDKLKELGVKLVVADMTERDQSISKDLKRADRAQIPVNLVYPSTYPNEPAILLEGLFSPGDALKALARAEKMSERIAIAPPVLPVSKPVLSPSK